MISRQIVWRLLATLVILPIALVLVLGMARLLIAMGDGGGALFLDRLALAMGLLWALDLVCLVIVLAIHQLGEREYLPHEDYLPHDEEE